MTHTLLPVTHVDFVTDNPFRLCSIGSANPLSKLQHQARITAQAAKDGFPIRVGLENIFDSKQAELCLSAVQNLAIDPKRLTVYRILWPLAYNLPASRDDTIKDLESLISNESDLLDSDDSISGLSVHALQLRFLVAWFRFLSDPYENGFYSVLARFKALYNDPDSDVFFAELLRRDGFEDPTNEFLFAAQKEVIRHLLKTACLVAVQCWQQGSDDVPLEILEHVRDCGFDQDEIDTAIHLVVPMGNAECARLKCLRENYGDWSPVCEDDESSASLLGDIALVLTRRIVAAQLWEQEVQRYNQTLFFAMRSYATNALNDRDDWQECQRVLKLLMASDALDQELEGKLYEDFAGLYSIMHRMSVDAANDRDDYTEATLFLKAILSGPDVAGWHEKARGDLARVQTIEGQNARNVQATLQERKQQEALLYGITKMTLTRHADAPVMNVKGPFEGLTHQTITGAEFGQTDGALWQHHMTTPLSVPPHYHEKEETVVVLTGTLRFYVGVSADDWTEGTDPLADAEVVDCGPEATFVVPARAIHAYDIVGVPARVLIFLPDPHAATLLPNGDPLPLPWQS